MQIEIKLVGKHYNIKVFDHKGNLLHNNYCRQHNLNKMIKELTKYFYAF